ncbi:MAG: lysylphosphatidylglycerol synthase transmembrane domain-containing protein [Bacteroidia bacterium]
MKSWLKSTLQFLFFLGIGILLVWLALRGLTEDEKEKISKAFDEADYFWIIFPTLLSGLSHFLRAARWKLLIQPLGYNPKLYNTFFALMVGYMANLAIPRLGEVSRCGILTKYEKIPFAESFGTVIAERAIDLLCLILIFLGTLVFEFEKLWGLTNERILNPLNEKLTALSQNSAFLWIALIVVLLIAGGLIFIFRKGKGTFLKKIKELALGFWGGVKSVKNIKRPYLFVLHTVLIWFLYIYVLYLSFSCFEELSVLGFGAALAAMLFGSLGIIFVPGGTGAYQVLVTQTLNVGYKASFPFAVAFSWLIWSAQFIFLLLVGLISLILLPILNKEVVAKQE